VRRGAGRPEREHRGRGRVRAHTWVAVLGHERGELGDVRRGLCDRERERGRAVERRADQLSSGAAVDLLGQPERGERLLVDLVVQRRELRQPLAKHLRLRDRRASQLPVR
jgi:hypothetical protein